MPRGNLEETACFRGIVGRSYNREATEKEIDMLVHLSWGTCISVSLAMIISPIVALKSQKGSVYRAASSAVTMTLLVLLILAGSSQFLGIVGEVLEVRGSDVVLRTFDGRDLIVSDGNVPGVLPGDKVCIGRSASEGTDMNYQVRSVTYRSAPTTSTIEP